MTDFYLIFILERTQTRGLIRMINQFDISCTLTNCNVQPMYLQNINTAAAEGHN